MECLGGKARTIKQKKQFLLQLNNKFLCIRTMEPEYLRYLKFHARNAKAKSVEYKYAASSPS